MHHYSVQYNQTMMLCLSEILLDFNWTFVREVCSNQVAANMHGGQMVCWACFNVIWKIVQCIWSSLNGCALEGLKPPSEYFSNDQTLQF